jgi:hypothetical protein
MTKDKFLQNVTDWDNHRVLLWLALEATEGPVIEMGCGDGSTRQLHEYCRDKGRMLYSFDTDQDWLNRFKDCESETHKFTRIVNNWQIAQDICPSPSVILIDHAPGERRIVDVKNYSDKINGIIVMHDTQPPPTAADYGYERIWPLFKYRVDLAVKMNYEANPPQNRTWASAVSNTHDVTKWIGLPTNNEDYEIR